MGRGVKEFTVHRRKNVDSEHRDMTDFPAKEVQKLLAKGGSVVI